MIRLADGRFAHGEIWFGGRGELVGPLIRLGETTVTDDGDITCTLTKGGWGRWVYCKYCYRNVAPYDLREESKDSGITRLCVCSECGGGLDLLEDGKRESEMGRILSS